MGILIDLCLMRTRRFISVVSLTLLVPEETPNPMTTQDYITENEKSPLIPSAPRGSYTDTDRQRFTPRHYDGTSIEAAFNSGARPSLIGPGSYPITLSWENINVKVKVHGKRSLWKKSVPSYEKLILDDVHGFVKPGSLVAIMGASGSGKSTLLNVLTNRNVKHYITTGTFRINGVEIENGLRNISAYVQQDEMFMHTLTVREHLQFRAILRMDKSLDRKARLERVEEVIGEMGLINCANSLIGTPGGTKKGVSGGEKKRLSFASEALTGPPIFFCDEPTSSLDSFMARNILQTLQSMAKRGASILCTIHQPASELFAMFDQLILLSEGRVAYLGKADDCPEFFNTLGYPCPKNYNPADHYINTLAIQPNNEEECRRKTNAICDVFKESEAAREMTEKSLMVARESDAGDRHLVTMVTDYAESSRYSSSNLTQLTQLTWRAWVAQRRNHTLFHIRFANCVFISLFLGLIYLDLDVDQTGVANINAAIFAIIFQIGNDDLFAVLSEFPDEMHLAMREYCSGLYSLRSYYIAKTVAELPMFCLTTVILSTITYWMAGFYDTTGAFLTFVGIMLLLATLSVSLGYFSSIVAGDTELALATAPNIVLLFGIFGGLLINTKDVPDFMTWMEELSWFKHSYQMMMINQWDDYGHIDCDVSNHTIGNVTNPGKGCTYGTGQDVLDFNGIDKDEKYEGLAIMLSMTAGFYIFGYVALYIRGRLSKE